MSKKQSSDFTEGDMNKWVNDTLTFIEGNEANTKHRNFKQIGLRLCQNENIDHKKVAKRAKQKLKKEERKFQNELNQLREQFHSLYFKELEAKNELNYYRGNKKPDKKKILMIENNIKKLKKVKSKIETSILELIGSLKSINQNFKFSYLPTKEERQEYVQKSLLFAKEKEKITNSITIQSHKTQLKLTNNAPCSTKLKYSYSDSYKSPIINPKLFQPPGLASMFATNPNSTNSVYGNINKNENSNDSNELSERIVTIRRVYLPDNEAKVTVTAKGCSPDQDKLLYTFINGQLVPANKFKDLKVRKKLRKKNELDTKISNIDSDVIEYNDQKLNQQMKDNIDNSLIYLTGNVSKLQKQNNCITLKTKETYENENVANDLECQINAYRPTNTEFNSIKSSQSSYLSFKNSKKNQSKRRKSLTKKIEAETNNMVYSSPEQIQLKFGQNDVLTLVKLDGADNINNCKKKYQKVSKLKFQEQNHICSNKCQCKFNSNLEDLCPSIKNLSLNPSLNESNNLYNSKSESPSIMEQLKQGVNVENLKLPPGISLTKVDPVTSQALRVKQNSIQKLSQSVNDICKQIPQQTYVPVYPNIEISPDFVHHDNSGLIMIDTNHSNLYQPSQYHRQFDLINDGLSERTSTALEPSNISAKQLSNYNLKKKKKKKQVLSETSNKKSSSKIITLKNPMFNQTSSVKSPTNLIRSGTMDDQPALITKNENGMFTIRNTALQENFLARYPYAGPGGILIPTSSSLGNPKSQCKSQNHNIGSLIGNHCDENKRNTFIYPHSLPFRESMKDHICEPNGY